LELSVTENGILTPKALPLTAIPLLSIAAVSFDVPLNSPLGAG
jgi:hypothetical protein